VLPGDTRLSFDFPLIYVMLPLFIMFTGHINIIPHTLSIYSYLLLYLCSRQFVEYRLHVVSYQHGVK
jgi:hypothetical protein